MYMSESNIEGWSEMSDWYQEQSHISLTDLHIAPLCAGDNELGLIDSYDGKRFLELGCGAAQNSIAADQKGAIAIGIDGSDRQLRHALRLKYQHRSGIDLVQADLEDLGWIKSNSMDCLLSMFALEFIQDIGRFLKHCFRILVSSGTFLLSTTHPLSAFEWDNQLSNLHVTDYFNPPVEVWGHGKEGSTFTFFRTIEDIFSAFTDAGFKVERLLEPMVKPEKKYLESPYAGDYWEPYRMRLEKVPFAVVIKARK